MGKIPVGETIAHAYGFAFRDYLKILGITWAPLVVSIAVGLMMTPGFFGAHVDLADSHEVARRSLRMLPLGLLILVPIRAMIAAGVTELALGLRTGTTFVYFSVGPAVWRIIGAWLLVIVAMVVLTVGVAIVFAIVAALGGVALGSYLHLSAAEAILMAVAAVVIFYGAIIYLAVRLTFLITPVVVAEKKIDLARGWQLTRGNFWRIFLVGLAIFLPILAISLAAGFAIYGSQIFHFFDLFSAALHGAKEDAVRAQMQGWSVAMRTRALAVWPYTAAFSLIFDTFLYGLSIGAAAFAYRAVEPAPGGPAMRG